MDGLQVRYAWTTNPAAGNRQDATQACRPDRSQQRHAAGISDLGCSIDLKAIQQGLISRSAREITLAVADPHEVQEVELPRGQLRAGGLVLRLGDKEMPQRGSGHTVDLATGRYAMPVVQWPAWQPFVAEEDVVRQQPLQRGDRPVGLPGHFDDQF